VFFPPPALLVTPLPSFETLLDPFPSWNPPGKNGAAYFLGHNKGPKNPCRKFPDTFSGVLVTLDFPNCPSGTRENGPVKNAVLVRVSGVI